MEPNSQHRYKELRLGQLRTFCECVRRKSFTEAARALNISQPAVWQQVRAFERDFGVSLLQQRGKNWEASEDGQLLLELASGIVGSVDSLHQVFRQRRGDLPRSLIVAGTPGVFIEECAQAVVKHCLRNPRVRTTMAIHPIRHVIELVITGGADVGVVPFEQILTKSRSIVCDQLCERPPALAVPEKHPLARKSRLVLEDLVKYPLILAEPGIEWRRLIDDVFQAAGLLDRLQIAVEVNNTHAARRYVSLGLGITILPLPKVALPFPGVITRPLVGLFPGEQVNIIWRRGCTPSAQAQAFIDMVREDVSET